MKTRIQVVSWIQAGERSAFITKGRQKTRHSNQHLFDKWKMLLASTFWTTVLHYDLKAYLRLYSI